MIVGEDGGSKNDTGGIGASDRGLRRDRSLPDKPVLLVANQLGGTRQSTDDLGVERAQSRKQLPAHPVAKKLRVAIAGVVAVGEFPVPGVPGESAAGVVQQRPQKTVFANRRHAPQTGCTAPQQTHQHCFGLVVRVVPQSDELTPGLGPDAIEKLVAQLPCSHFEGDPRHSGATAHVPRCRRHRQVSGRGSRIVCRGISRPLPYFPACLARW